MQLKYLAGLLLWAGPLLAQTGTFDNNNEGWRASGDPVSTTASWQPTGGNPGGYIRVTDAAIGGTWYFESSSQYKGNKCDAYDRFLRWDQFTSDTANQQPFGGAPDVVLEGANLTLVFDNAQNPGLAWTHYDIQLREDAGWHLDDIAGPAPTAQQFQAVLANISALRIRGEYRSQADYGGIDNFILESSFRFDLDADDSSGEPTGGFNADTTCSTQAAIADLDAVLLWGQRVDSVLIQVLFAQNPALETLQAGVIPAGILVQQPTPGKLRLINTGAATPADFTAALLAVQYADLSPSPARNVRIVSVTVFTECGNMGQRFAYLPIFPAGDAGIDADTMLCASGAPVDLFQLLGGTPETGGTWKPALASGTSLFNPSIDPPGTYAYSIPGAGPCPGDTAFVNVRTEQAFQLRNDTTICYGEQLLLVIPLNLINWTWSDGSKQTVLEVNAPGTYTLNGLTEHCTFSDSVHIDFYTCEECPLYAPNVFTPGKDGQNQEWAVFLPCAWSRFRLEVFDRWGNQVFVAEDPALAWDGRWRGKEMPAGVYAWRLEWEGELFGEKKIFRKGGDLTIIR